ncbi:DUF2809 domain-containing protein [Psychrobacillus sp. NPDC096389]|uniref:ribosomal maturation YjgA family protein n=1 Tax=Psychrobacillus sp. NPDC096389 TaxID=3364490 RepID=UPI0038250E02
MIPKSEYINFYYPKCRFAYILAVFTTIFFGLASRKYSYFLSPFVAENAGDIIWAMMVYFEFRFLLVRKSLVIAIFLSFIFSFAIECSQLYQGDWMKQIRATSLGALIFGKGFLTVDLLRYAVGIILGAFLDKIVLVFSKIRHHE